ncbi:DUF1524 domain-containing protein [Corynebacterium amycolatum]|nr:DUF1524 domain-containing protein [Corynebacterium amycolatum]
MDSAWKHTLGNFALTSYNSQLDNKAFDWKRADMAWFSL